MEKKLTQQEQKELVGKIAVNRLIEQGGIFSGMKIGLGTGSTAMWALRRLGDRLNDGTLSGIRAVATSFQTVIACEELGIPVYSLNSKEIGGKIDLTIDGADEINPQGQLIKGGGAALLLEKIIAYNSARYVIIADSSKLVETMGTGFPLPIEVIPEARVAVTLQLVKKGASCQVRQAVKKDGPIITDNGNIIIDVLWNNPIDPAQMESEINQIPGVVENGFFTRNHPAVFISMNDGKVLER